MGYNRHEIEEGIVKGISLTLGAILILLAVWITNRHLVTGRHGTHHDFILVYKF